VGRHLSFLHSFPTPIDDDDLGEQNLINRPMFSEYLTGLAVVLAVSVRQSSIFANYLVSSPQARAHHKTKIRS
jgi:hypothetical protein